MTTHAFIKSLEGLVVEGLYEHGLGDVFWDAACRPYDLVELSGESRRRRGGTLLECGKRLHNRVLSNAQVILE